MIKTLFISALALAVTTGATLPAAAFGGCNPCYPQPQYRQVVTPAQYRVIHRTVMVSPPRVITHRIPAQYGVVQQTVMVSPPRVGVQAVCDSCGNVGYRHFTVPAQYGTVARTVMVSPPRYVAEMIPARYATVAHTEMVAPPQAYWVSSGCNSCGY